MHEVHDVLDDLLDAPVVREHLHLDLGAGDGSGPQEAVGQLLQPGVRLVGLPQPLAQHVPLVRHHAQERHLGGDHRDGVLVLLVPPAGIRLQTGGVQRGGGHDQAEALQLVPVAGGLVLLEPQVGGHRGESRGSASPQRLVEAECGVLRAATSAGTGSGHVAVIPLVYPYRAPM
ncbi:hypothetical protein LUW77_27045 [Streptomyces radiopugnans]|nr:hypothetical protein LUW77_27045 [Streptomyces radiopugnans]